MSTTHERLSLQTTVHSRRFGHSAEAVQRAHTDPGLFAQWMGPAGTRVDVDRFDAVTGGAFRYVVRAGSDGAWAFRGTYHLVEPGRVVHTWQYEDEPSISLEDLRFTDLPGGASLLSIRSTHGDAGLEERLEELNMANEELAANLDRLAALLDSLRP